MCVIIFHRTNRSNFTDVCSCSCATHLVSHFSLVLFSFCCTHRCLAIYIGKRLRTASSMCVWKMRVYVVHLGLPISLRFLVIAIVLPVLVILPVFVAQLHRRCCSLEFYTYAFRISLLCFVHVPWISCYSSFLHIGKHSRITFVWVSVTRHALSRCCVIFCVFHVIDDCPITLWSLYPPYSMLSLSL